MLSDIVDFFEFLGCLSSLPFGERKEERKLARESTRAARRKRMRSRLGSVAAQDYFDNRTGTIAHDASKKVVGIAVSASPVMCVLPGKVPKLERCADDPRCFQLELTTELMGSRVFPLKFDTPQKADYWYGVLEGRR